MALSYFKVLSGMPGRVDPDDLVFFEDTSLDSIRAAWELAERKRSFKGGRKIVAGQPVALSGPWSDAPVTFWSGVCRSAR